MSNDYSAIGFSSQRSKDRKHIEILRYGKIVKVYKVARTMKELQLFSRRLDAFLAKFNKEFH